MLDKTNYNKPTELDAKYDLQLPDKLSALIRVALGDLERVEKDPAYKVDMGEWHNPNTYGGTCFVCLAGAVMTRVLSPNQNYVTKGVFESFDSRIKIKFSALNYVREDDIVGAIRTMDNDEHFRSSTSVRAFLKRAGFTSRKVPDYSAENSALFKEQLYLIADDLEKVGL